MDQICAFIGQLQTGCSVRIGHCFPLTTPISYLRSGRCKAKLGRCAAVDASKLNIINGFPSFLDFFRGKKKQFLILKSAIDVMSSVNVYVGIMFLFFVIKRLTEIYFWVVIFFKRVNVCCSGKLQHTRNDINNFNINHKIITTFNSQKNAQYN